MQGSKPLRYTGEEANMDREDIKMLVKKWWDIYNDESLNYKPAANQANDPLCAALASSVASM